MIKAAVSISMAAVLLLAAVAAGDDEVILKSRRFVPPAGLSESLRAHTRTASGRMHVIIQLEDMPAPEQRLTFINTGVHLLSYIPNRAWLAGAPADKLAQIAGLPGVRAVTEILPHDKLAPSIRDGGINAFSLNGAGEAKLVAQLFKDVTIEAGAQAVEALGGRVVGRDPDEKSLVFYLPAGMVEALAADDCIKWIDQHYESVDLNDGARAAIGVDPVQADPYNLTGAGVVLGQWESRHPDATHVDLAGRVINVDANEPMGDHATQVAGTMIGDGWLLPSRLYRGMAPAATIVSFLCWENVSDLREQYRRAVNVYGINIANNSWGKVQWHAYQDYAAAMDAIVRGDLGKPISIVWAVGNEGHWGTILSTAAAKNTIAVGATNSDDNSLWQWSNKGPTGDGRIKPDAVAPGCETCTGCMIWSTLPGNRYGGACGTSMAVPSVSGTTALILEDWRRTHRADPLPSTIKALLLHSATDLGNPGPDYAFGFGLINAKSAIDLVRADTLDEVVIEDAISQQGEQDLYAIQVAGDGGMPLKVTLVWDDYPADPLTARALVNDLDLVVTGPDGRQYDPWTLDADRPQDPARQIQADHTNNVEQVYVANPVAGAWQVAVVGRILPQGPQRYSLVTDPPGFAGAGDHNLGI